MTMRECDKLIPRPAIALEAMDKATAQTSVASLDLPLRLVHFAHPLHRERCTTSLRKKK